MITFGILTDARPTIDSIPHSIFTSASFEYPSCHVPAHNSQRPGELRILYLPKLILGLASGFLPEEPFSERAVSTSFWMVD